MPILRPWGVVLFTLGLPAAGTLAPGTDAAEPSFPKLPEFPVPAPGTAASTPSTPALPEIK
jgi:hypothetical protein